MDCEVSNKSGSVAGTWAVLVLVMLAVMATGVGVEISWSRARGLPG